MFLNSMTNQVKNKSAFRFKSRLDVFSPIDFNIPHGKFTSPQGGEKKTSQARLVDWCWLDLLANPSLRHANDPSIPARRLSSFRSNRARLVLQEAESRNCPAVWSSSHQSEFGAARIDHKSFGTSVRTLAKKPERYIDCHRRGFHTPHMYAVFAGRSECCCCALETSAGTGLF